MANVTLSRGTGEIDQAPFQPTTCDSISKVVLVASATFLILAVIGTSLAASGNPLLEPYLYVFVAADLLSLAVMAGACCKLKRVNNQVEQQNLPSSTKKPEFVSVKNLEKQANTEYFPVGMYASYKEERCVIGPKGEICLSKYTYGLDSCDPQNYQNWVLERQDFSKDEVRKKCQNNIKTILSETATNDMPACGEIVYYRVQMQTKAMNQLLNTRVHGYASFSFSPNFYDYERDEEFYVDFANANHFGGEYRFYGNAQEERIFFEFNQLVHLAYMTQKHPPLPASKGEPTPFLIPNVKRTYDVSRVPYGKDLGECQDVYTRIRKVKENEQKNVHILGVAARNWRRESGPREYTEGDLQYLFKATYAAFSEARYYHENFQNHDQPAVIHTGALGCGVFENSQKTVMMIQLLAAQMAGVRLVFHAIGLNAADLFGMNNKIVGNSPKKVFAYILEEQKTDKTWAPQQPKTNKNP